MSNPTREQAIAQERAGDKAGAQATRTALLLQQRSQDAFFLTLRSQLLKKQGRTADRPGPTAGEGQNGGTAPVAPPRLVEETSPLRPGKAGGGGGGVAQSGGGGVAPERG